MYDYTSIVPDADLPYKFIESGDNPNVLNAFTRNGECVGTVTRSDGTFEVSDDKLFEPYKLWQTRPERAIGRIVPIGGQTMEELMDSYEELLVGAYICNRPYEEVRAKGTNGFCKMLDWLRTTDFYTSPASTRYHESHPGGLLVHSLKVYNMAMQLLDTPQFAGVNPASVTMATLTHDWCKIGLYESYTRNVKNEATGQWEKVPAFKRNQKGIPLGHGATSMYLASNFFHLSPEEACAIRWHQGHWNVCDSEVNEFQLANEKYPMVHLLQFADQLSITNYAIKED